MSIEFKNVDNINKTEWDKYLNEIGGFSLYHTYDQVNFYVKTNENIKNISFFCFLDQKPIALAPLGLTKSNKFNTLSFNQYPCHVPLINKNLIPRTKRKIEDTIYKKINTIIENEKIDYADFLYHPIVKNEKIQLNYENSFSILKYFDVKINSINSSYINLDNNEITLENRLQKSLRKEIKNKIYQKLKIEIIDKNSSFDEINKFVEIAKKIHFENAKKETRSLNSWEFIKRGIQNGSSSLFLIKENSKYIAYLWCTELSNLFASGASQASVKNEFYYNNSVRFYLEWFVIKFYQKKKFKFYEVGQHYYFNQNWMKISDKQKRIGISKLKFGGTIYPRHYFRYENKNNVFNNKEYI